jgi:hypothetical protein
VVLGERKVVMGIQPTVIGAAQGVERSEFKHDASPVGQSGAWARYEHGASPGQSSIKSVKNALNLIRLNRLFIESQN